MLADDLMFFSSNFFLSGPGHQHKFELEFNGPDAQVRGPDELPRHEMRGGNRDGREQRKVRRRRCL